jgi:PST family polysaccharide transporter
MLSINVLKGAGWMVSSRFLGRAIDLLTLLVLARVLTPADFGLTALAITLAIIVDTVLEIPVTQALVRLGRIDKSHLDTAFTLGILRGLLIGVGLLAAAWPVALVFGDSRLAPLLMVLALAPIARGLYSPSMVRFAIDLSFRQTFLIEAIGKLCGIAVAIAIVLSGGGYWAIILNHVLAPVVMALASYVVAPYRPAFSLARLSDFWSFLGWFSSGQIVSVLSWHFDRMLLGGLVDKATLGRYAVAGDLSMFPAQSLIGPAMAPILSAFARIGTDRVRLQQGFLKAARVAMLVAIPVGIGIALTADLVVAIVLGPRWQGAGTYLQWLALSVVPVPYFQTLFQLSMAADRPVVMFRLSLHDLALRLVLVPLGLVLLSVMGVLMARIAIAIVMLGVCFWEARNLVGIGLLTQLRNIWKAAAAAAVMAASVYLLRHALSLHQLSTAVELVLVAAVGAAVYAGTLMACGVRLIVGPGKLELADRWW